MRVARISLAIFLLLAMIAAIWYLQRPTSDRVWRINFAPDTSPDFQSFITIDADADYSHWRGYGWLDTEGRLKNGRWPGDHEDTWESRSNLNVIQRRGPDDLARSFASGPATFALDLDPGTYEVWVLSGDAGHLEFIPHEPYRILVEGEEAYRFAPGVESVRAQLETPPEKEPFDHQAVWEQLIAPRYRWSKMVVAVFDGQLSVTMDSQKRDTDMQTFMGEYAHTEQRSAPAPAYTGALNALVVFPFEGDVTVGEKLIQSIDELRQKNVREHWPQAAPDEAPVVVLNAAGEARGYTVSPVNVLSPVMPDDRYPHLPAIIRLRATPGEYVPVTVAVTPLIDLGTTRVVLSALHNSNGTVLPVTPDLTYGVVRYQPTAVTKRGQSWRPGPAMIVPQDHQNIEQGVARQFWLTYHVPANLAAGMYHASLVIEPEKAVATQLEIELEVLPFTLRRPTHLAVGMTYFSPVQYALQGEDAFWQRLQAEFADMRAHNMTSVQYTGIRMDDYTNIDRAFALYREAGFEQPINFLESYGAMMRWPRNGVEWSSPVFLAEYVALVSDFLEQASARKWPPVIINFGDEFTNTAIEEIGAEIARHLRVIPDIVTAADVDGYKELTLLAPEVDIVAFNNGWDGPQQVNKGKRLLHGKSVDFILESGATPWLVNIGMDRFSNGFWFWKMIQRGVRGKMEWMYRGYNGMPYNAFDANPLRPHAVYPGANGSAIPSLKYEWMRIGLDDLAYLHTLAHRLEAAHGNDDYDAVITATETYFNKLDELINDDMSFYRNQEYFAQRQWPASRYQALRDEAIELILQFE